MQTVDENAGVAVPSSPWICVPPGHRKPLLPWTERLAAQEHAASVRAAAGQCAQHAASAGPAIAAGPATACVRPLTRGPIQNSATADCTARDASNAAGIQRISIPTASHIAAMCVVCEPLVLCTERCHRLTRTVSQSEKGFSIVQCPYLCNRTSPHSGHGSHTCGETHDPNLDGHPSRVIAIVHPPGNGGQVSCLQSGVGMVAEHTTAVCCHRRCGLDAVDLCAGCGVPRCDLHIAQCSLCGRGMFCHICVEPRRCPFHV